MRFVGLVSYDSRPEGVLLLGMIVIIRNLTYASGSSFKRPVIVLTTRFLLGVQTPHVLSRKRFRCVCLIKCWNVEILALDSDSSTSKLSICKVGVLKI